MEHPQEVLRVVALAVSTIGRCDAASATLLGILDFDGEVCTSAVAYRLDQAQHGDGGGPCVDAVRFLQIFNVGCISTAATWHDYRVAAAADGIRSRPLGPADHRRRRHRHAQPLLGGSRRLRWLWNVAATYIGAASAAMVPPDVVTSRAGCRETRENLRVSFSRHFRLVSPDWGRVPAETLPGFLLLSAPPTLSRLRRDRTYSAHV